jgi:hypothetical protein
VSVVVLISASKGEFTHRATLSGFGEVRDPRAQSLKAAQMESNNGDVQTKVAYALRKLDWKEQGTS